MIEITENLAYKVWMIYCKDRYNKSKATEINETHDFLHDVYVYGSSFDEAYEDNIKSFTKTQALELCSIFENLEGVNYEAIDFIPKRP